MKVHVNKLDLNIKTIETKKKKKILGLIPSEDWNYFLYRLNYKLSIIPRFFKKIKKIFEYIPIVYKTEDYDASIHSVELFIFSLKRVYKEIKNTEFPAMNRSHVLSRMELLFKIYDRITEDYYYNEYLEKINKFGGNMYDSIGLNKNNEVIENIFSDGDFQVYKRYEIFDISNEEKRKYEDFEKESYEKYLLKSKKIDKLFWKVIEHNIDYWWD